MERLWVQQEDKHIAAAVIPPSPPAAHLAIIPNVMPQETKIADQVFGHSFTLARIADEYLLSPQ
jgi:hypothetical protein